jgi:hypothetical protein
MKPEVPPQNNSGESTEDEVPDLEFRVSLPTDWVIYDQQMIPIMVAAKDKGKDSAQQQALMMTEDEELAETVG